MHNIPGAFPVPIMQVSCHSDVESSLTVYMMMLSLLTLKSNSRWRTNWRKLTTVYIRLSSQQCCYHVACLCSRGFSHSFLCFSADQKQASNLTSEQNKDVYFAFVLSNQSKKAPKILIQPGFSLWFSFQVEKPTTTQPDNQQQTTSSASAQLSDHTTCQHVGFSNVRTF